MPERVYTNADLEQFVDTTDEWIVERTGIRERRFAEQHEAFTDLALPAAREALRKAGVEGKDIDLLICATVTPDMMFPTSSALLADSLGAADAGAYDLLAGCTGFMYAIAQAYGMLASGLSQRALVVGGDVLSKILDWTRPLDARPLRRRRRRGRAGAGRRRRLPRLRARGRRRPAASISGFRAAARATSTTPTRS